MAGRRHYGWVIFGLSFANLLAEGGIKNTVPVVYVALRDSFRWSAAASAVGAVGLVGMVGRPLSGTLSDLLGREVVYTVGSGMQIGGTSHLPDGPSWR
jgi:MFS family permease